MAKQSTTLKQNTATTLKTTGYLQAGLEIETEDMGVLSLEQLLSTFQGKLVTVQVKETQEEELDVV